METIRTSGSLPMKKAPIRLESRDDRLQGELLSAEVLAAAKGHDNIWLAFAWRVIDMTPEARDVFVNRIKAEKSAMTKGQTEAGVDEKTAKSRTATFGVQVSRLTGIAKAWNAGGSVEGLCDYMNQGFTDKSKHAKPEDMRAHASFIGIYEYAKILNGSGLGRKPDALVVKLAKFIKANTSTDADANDTALIAKLTELYKEFNKD
jgi:hypothetical protein